jgi:hypothetical protein
MVDSFFDELEKIAEEQDRQITRERLKRFAKTLVPVAIGTGLGYGTYKALQPTIQKHITKNPQIAKYLLPMAGGVGAALGVVRKELTKEIDKRVMGEPVRNNTS